jgi:CRISPR/Cas system CSM-associated protein Csm3 (group 7 of RAMP superfamily)
MIKINLRLITERKLNIGSGGIAPKIKAEIPFMSIRDFNGSDNILIPGSTIKGVLRTSLIKISSLLGYDYVTHTINPEDKVSDDIVTKLFGKPNDNVQSKISVGSVMVKARTETLTHVRISDDTRTAESGSLFSVEYLPIGYIIDLTIEARDLSIEEARALMTAIANLRYERIGKSGIVDVKIKDSYGFEKYLPDPVIKEIYDSLR